MRQRQGNGGLSPNVSNTFTADQNNTARFVNNYTTDYTAGAGNDVYLARAGNAGASGAVNLKYNSATTQIDLIDDANDYKILKVEALVGGSISVEDVFLGDNATILPGGIMYAGPASQIRNDILNFFYDTTNGLTVKRQVNTRNLYPDADDTYYLGKNDDDTPKAWKGVILKDTSNGKYYRIQITAGVINAVDLTD